MQESVQTSPTPISQSSMRSATPPMSNTGGKECCKDGKCDSCLKGGLPVKKEVTSFLFILFVGIATVLFILLVNEKRKVLQMNRDAESQQTMRNSEETKENAEPEKVSYAMPAEKKFSAEIELPKPKLKGKVSVEEALQSRRSRRTYATDPVTLDELSQILWAGQGVTDESGHRTAPSARSAYPYTLYVIVRNVEGMTPGLYAYLPGKHALGDLDLLDAGGALITAGVQDNSQKAPVVIAMTGAPAIMAEKFPDDPMTNLLIEAGHIGQNFYLETEALGMSTVVTGGFDAKKVGEALKLDPHERIVYLIPFGHRDETAVEEGH